MKPRRILIGIGIGVLVTPAAVFVALLSSGAGHGHYVFTRGLFPYSMLLTRFANDTITYPLILLALVQFPLYGAIIGLAASKRWLACGAAILIAVVHAMAVARCFSPDMANFSYHVPANKTLHPKTKTCQPLGRAVNGQIVGRYRSP